ncbi:MAG: sulfotransferase [Candidatus Saccharibacteria bacterium]|nr:sulfotransferase [Pseudorhodobacter sp.]
MTTDRHSTTLMFGVGATKAGTSWLHSQLQAHPQCHLKTIKELHYFSLTTPQQVARALKTAESDAEAARQKARVAGPDKRDYAARRAADLTAWCGVLQAGLGAQDRYLDYLQQGRGERRLIGDVTPGYSLLAPETLTMMSRLAPDVRFVYLMRDPVERLWSHVRMVCARADRGNFADGALHLLTAILDGQHSNEIDGILKRGDYSAILDRLAQAVPHSTLLTVFYEDMFAPGGLTELCDFLGITPVEPVAEAKVHAGVPLTMPPDLRKRAQVFLQHQYHAVERRMGTIPAKWAMNRL